MRIGVLCSGGDAPGMNPCIRAIVRDAFRNKDETIGIMHGYQGIFDEEFFTRDRFDTPAAFAMGIRAVSGLSMRGGTVLHSSRCQRFTQPEGVKAAAEILDRHRFDAILPIGGNGTLAGAIELGKYWKGQIIGLPGTIDNDLLGTDATIGYATAVQTAVEAVDKLRDTAGSHDMMFLVEVMGRHCGDIALSTAIASGAELVCVPEIPTDIGKIVERLKLIKEIGKTSVIMIVAEGDDHGGAMKLQQALKEAGNPFESRCVVLGHVQRGGSPAPADRILATELGCFAVDALHKGETGKMAGKINNQLTLTPLEEAVKGHRQVSLEQLHLLDIVAS